VKCLAQRWSVVSPETCVTANNEFANQNNPEAYTLRIVISGLFYPFIAAMLVLFLHSFQLRFCPAAAVDGQMNLPRFALWRMRKRNCKKTFRSGKWLIFGSISVDVSLIKGDKCVTFESLLKESSR
jgi:hypothetical protein